ncbi:Coilin, partial [Frankliniella fusca]
MTGVFKLPVEQPIVDNKRIKLQPQRSGFGTAANNFLKIRSLIIFHCHDNDHQFSNVARNNGWSPERKRDELLNALSGKAVQFLQCMPHLRENSSFNELNETLRRTYGQTVTIWERLNQFQSLKQEDSESLQDFSRRVETSATLAYPTMPSSDLTQLKIQAFVQGLKSESMKSSLAFQTFPTLMAAMDAAIQGTTILSCGKTPVKRARQTKVEEREEKDEPATQAKVQMVFPSTSNNNSSGSSGPTNSTPSTSTEQPSGNYYRGRGRGRGRGFRGGRGRGGRGGWNNGNGNQWNSGNNSSMCPCGRRGHSPQNCWFKSQQQQNQQPAGMGFPMYPASILPRWSLLAEPTNGERRPVSAQAVYDTTGCTWHQRQRQRQWQWQRKLQTGKLEVAASSVVKTAADTSLRPQDFPTPGSPMVKCTINGVNCDAVIDSGAVITIVRRGRLGETLPLSKLRVKGVTSGTGKLYGPKLMSYNFGGLQLRFPTYEGDIEDNCLIGNDFLDYFDIAVESARRKITIRRLSPQELLDEPNEVPCTMVHSPSVGRFQAGLVYYVARAHKNLTLAPMADIKIQTIFKPDVAQKGKMESSVHTNKSNKTKDSINNATNYLQSLPPDEEKALKLGLVSRPLTTTNASLDPDVLVMSGVIPCIPAPLELHIFNASDHYVKISKSTVIAEVYLLDPTDYNQPITEIKEYELPQEGPAKVQRSTVQNYPEKSSFNRRVLSIEVDYKIPEKAPITPFEPLPDDLQDLVQRCKNLNPDQIKQVEDLLRKHHDVFAKDNTTFGCCPWVKFTIDTGDHPPIKLQARPIPLHYRQAVYETFLKYLECGAVRP